jgi:hypothetical protein
LCGNKKTAVGPNSPGTKLSFDFGGGGYNMNVYGLHWDNGGIVQIKGLSRTDTLTLSGAYRMLMSSAFNTTLMTLGPIVCFDGDTTSTGTVTGHLIGDSSSVTGGVFTFLFRAPQILSAGLLFTVTSSGSNTNIPRLLIKTVPGITSVSTVTMIDGSALRIDRPCTIDSPLLRLTASTGASQLIATDLTILSGDISIPSVGTLFYCCRVCVC